ncbi:Uncharacterised protein [Mycoplasmoides gallisepticum]|uniref:Uncharacterized protein n=1 Tax=Mycoplasmoides gallisepticum TaxID=2096 RepID=A0A3B0PG57_MYCGL|nr:Uncharacterised protein [Mycoplasmoides gallisepticum]
MFLTAESNLSNSNPVPMYPINFLFFSVLKLSLIGSKALDKASSAFARLASSVIATFVSVCFNASVKLSFL